MRQSRRRSRRSFPGSNGVFHDAWLRVEPGHRRGNMTRSVAKCFPCESSFGYVTIPARGRVFPGRKMATIGITNQKGGCGKTVTAINLAAGLARAGLSTLVVDLDPQAPIAAGLGVKP